MSCYAWSLASSMDLRARAFSIGCISGVGWVSEFSWSTLSIKHIERHWGNNPYDFMSFTISKFGKRRTRAGTWSCWRKWDEVRSIYSSLISITSFRRRFFSSLRKSLSLLVSSRDGIERRWLDMPSLRFIITSISVMVMIMMDFLPPTNSTAGRPAQKTLTQHFVSPLGTISKVYTRLQINVPCLKAVYWNGLFFLSRFY